MFPKSNLHSHSLYSDGKSTLEELVRAAIDRGFFSLGISEHGVEPHGSAGMSVEGEREYIAEMHRLKEKYAGQIELVLGLEHDFITRDVDLSPYEYVIESVHALYCSGEYVTLDNTEAELCEGARRHYGGDLYRMSADYFRAVCQSIEQAQAQILGHIGLISKFNDDGHLFDARDPRYAKPFEEAMHLAVERDMIVEVNTGAISRGYRTSPYPDGEQLRLLRKMGGRILFSSDCHRAEHVDCAFDLAAELARAAGFRECVVWKNGGFQTQAL